MCKRKHKLSSGNMWKLQVYFSVNKGVNKIIVKTKIIKKKIEGREGGMEGWRCMSPKSRLICVVGLKPILMTS